MDIPFEKTQEHSSEQHHEIQYLCKQKMKGNLIIRICQIKSAIKSV